MQGNAARNLYVMPDAAEPRPAAERSGLAIMMCSGDLDRVMAALIIATGAASMGQPVQLFVAFSATFALRRAGRPRGARSWRDRLFAWLTPRSAEDLGLGHLHLGGLGTALMRARMRQRGIPDCAELLTMAGLAGVQISVCSMTLDLVGLTVDDLVDYPGLRVCGVATFLDEVERASTTMFV
jgi:peroxiredoxin family protein